MIKKTIKINDCITVVLNGESFTFNNVTPEIEQSIENANTREELLVVGDPHALDNEALIERVKSSKYLNYEGDIIYMRNVCRESLPKTFIIRFLEAEEQDRTNVIEAYKNFWTLLCLNPDPVVRNNTFWFLDRWNIKITKLGLIVAYRNAIDKGEYYTDAHSGTTCIKIGQITSIPRDKCDTDSNVTCSRGLSIV